MFSFLLLTFVFNQSGRVPCRLHKRREEQPEEDQMVAKRIPCLWPGSVRSCQCRPRGDAEALLEQRARTCTCNGLRPILCSELAENTGDMFLGSSERDHELVGDILV